MIIIDCVQGSEEWKQARLTVATASEFKKIITPTGKVSTQADAYANQLLAELMVGKPIESFESPWMARGKEQEEAAALAYEVIYDVKAEKAGFCKSDDGRIGCSVDRLIGDDGLLEIKVPAPHTHVQYLLDATVDRDYYPQIQGQLLVTGRKWVDWMSYHPEMPPVVIRVYRDEAYINAMIGLLKIFADVFDAKRNRLRLLGHL